MLPSAVIPRMLRQTQCQLTMTAHLGRATYLSSNHPYQNDPKCPTVHFMSYFPAEEHFGGLAPLLCAHKDPKLPFYDGWRRVWTRDDHYGMFKSANANVSIYAKEDGRRSDVTVYYPGTVYEGNAGYLPRFSYRGRERMNTHDLARPPLHACIVHGTFGSY